MAHKIFFCNLKSKKKEKCESLLNFGIESDHFITTDLHMKLQKWID